METALIVVTIILLLGLLVMTWLYYASQQKLAQEVFQRKQELDQLERDAQDYIEKLKLLHVQELDEMRILVEQERQTLQKRTRDLEKAQDENSLANQKQKAGHIIADAESTAESIVLEAQEKVRIMLAKERANLNKAMVKIVIQVVKRVLGKALSYKEHKQLILDSIEEIE